MGRIAVASIVILWLIPISILVNQIVPDPYMDEIFHVPQAKQYCRANFASWDPMITTPPGLYFLSLAYIASLFPGLFCMQDVSSFPESCTTSVLRLTNGVLSVTCSILIYEIIRHLSPWLDDKKATLRAVVLSLYPLHWFFSFLYYTDVASLTAVLAMYLLSLKKKYMFSSLLGALSVLIRQTNIIWVLFVACTGVIEFTRSHRKDSVEINDITSKDKDDLPGTREGAPRISNLRKRRGYNNDAKRCDKFTPQKKYVPMTHLSGLLNEIQDIIVISWNHCSELFVSISPFFMVFVAFVAFVRWNGSIVLGAKDAHSVSLHFPQLLYFGLVSACFVGPILFSLGQAPILFRKLCNCKLLGFFQCFTAITIGFLFVHYFRLYQSSDSYINWWICTFIELTFFPNNLLKSGSASIIISKILVVIKCILVTFVVNCFLNSCSIAHPYLLADNRHYPFYLWRKVLNYHWSTKYLMVPLYVYSWLSIFLNLAKIQTKLWVLVYFMACAASLIPTPLIEFRYYTIPFFFLVLHINITENKSWVLIGILYIAINCFVMYMFLLRPFSWKHEGGVQRFIW